MIENQSFSQIFKVFIVLLPIILLLSLASCTPLGLLNAVIPSNHYKQSVDIAFGNGELQKLDVYRPTEPCKSCPVVIWVYGGAWNSGDKEEYQFIGEAFTSAGMIVVIPNYRKYPQVRFPDFIDDVANAVSWVNKNIQQYGGDPNQLNLMGHSAGAHIVMMLAFDPQYLAKAHVPKASIKTAIGLAGPYDFLPSSEDAVAQTFATAVPLEAGQPITYANGNGPPTLLAVGLEDVRVSPKNTFSLAKKIQDNGGRIELIRYPHLGHPDIVLSLSKPFRGLSSVRRDVLKFIRNPDIHIDKN